MRLQGTATFPLRCRDDLSRLAAELGLDGNACEVGARDGGEFAKNLLRLWGGKTLTIVRHASVKMTVANATLERAAAFRSAEALKLNDRTRVNTRVDWLTGDIRLHLQASRFEDGSLDWLHLTNHQHTGEAMILDLDHWWPTLRRGGIVSGGDFIDRCDPRRPLHTDSIEMIEKGGTARGQRKKNAPTYSDFPSSGDGVRWAVKEWFGKRAIPFFVTYMNYCHTEPTWYAIKP